MTGTDPSALAPFSATIANHEGVAIANVGGAVTLEHADALRDRLLAAADEPIRGFIVDLSALTFISSDGLGAIMAVYLRCRRLNVEFRVAGVSGNVLRMFEVAKLDRLFSLFPTTEAARTGLPS